LAKIKHNTSMHQSSLLLLKYKQRHTWAGHQSGLLQRNGLQMWRSVLRMVRLPVLDVADSIRIEEAFVDLMGQLEYSAQGTNICGCIDIDRSRHSPRHGQPSQHRRARKITGSIHPKARRSSRGSSRCSCNRPQIATVNEASDSHVPSSIDVNE